ncbi:MAG: short-chain dehydrogenase/reductase [Burkholderiales bacterium]|nr:short-chain dehydrogenase/reductase [Burkholderiales bacterium]
MARAVPSMAGQVVLLTGAGSGIGAAAAHELKARGAFPILVDIDRHMIEPLALALGDNTLCVVADVTDMAACEAAVQAALRRHGRIDVVWANAGVAAFGQLAHIDPVAWKRVIEVNVMGVFNTVRAALPHVVAQRGFIAVTASSSSFAHPPALSAYAASKAAVEAMCNAWRIELAAHDVGVGAIHAAWVRTPLVTEGALHPGFVRLRQTMPRQMNVEVDAVQAARIMVDGIARRDRRIWVPGWVRWLHWLRALLHTPMGERELLRAAPDIERHYLEGLAAEGRLASSFGPRELQRAQERARQGSTAP